LQKFFPLKKRIKKNEGFSNCAYLDSLGNHTIGYGHLIKKNEPELLKKKLSKKKLSNIFERDFEEALSCYKKSYKKNFYSKNIEEVFIEMIFQMGYRNHKQFVKMLRYIKQNNLFLAALEMKNSLWYKQTPKRVDVLINVLLKKEYEN
jgi:lysozyme